MENTLWNDPTDISQTSAANRARRALLACSAVIVLASCSAGPADSTDAGGTNSPAPAVPSTSSSPTPVPPSAATPEPLHEPLSPDSRSYPAEELVLSEKGTGSGRYVLEGGLREGESLTIAVTCTPGGELDVKTDPAIAGIGNFRCGNGPLDMSVSNPALVRDIPDLSVTVETSSGASFWVQARVHGGA